MAVPMVIQRTGYFTAGDDTPSEWNIFVAFDSASIMDNRLTTDEVGYLAVTTEAGIYFPDTNYLPETWASLVGYLDIAFIGGSPTTDDSIFEIVQLSPNGPFAFLYIPYGVRETFDYFDGVNILTYSRIGDYQQFPEAAGWWSFIVINSPAVPEPVTSTLLIVGTLALARRRRVA